MRIFLGFQENMVYATVMSCIFSLIQWNMRCKTILFYILKLGETFYLVLLKLLSVPCKFQCLYHLCHSKEHPLMEDDMKVSRTLISLWANFAKYGDPTPPLSLNNEIGWTQSTSESFPLYANISGSIPTMVENSDDYNRRMNFWTQLLN